LLLISFGKIDNCVYVYVYMNLMKHSANALI